MSVTDYAKALTDFWSSQSNAMLEAQEKATRAVTDSMQAMLTGRLPLGVDGRDVGTAAAELGQATESMAQLISAAASMSSELAKKLTGQRGREQPDDIVSAVYGRITDPRQWLAGFGGLEEALSKAAEGPRLADLFDLERRYARVSRAWLQAKRRTLELNAILLDAWLQAGRRFTEELAGHAGADGQTLEPKRALAIWTEVANRVLLETQRSEPFLKAQRELIRSTTELQLSQQDLVEHFGKQYGFPTRTELDDVHRTLTEIRREMRKLRRMVPQHASASASPPPLAHAAPASAPATPAEHAIAETAPPDVSGIAPAPSSRGGTPRAASTPSTPPRRKAPKP